MAKPKSYRDRIVEKIVRWDTAQLKSEVATYKDLFVREGIEKERYAVEGVYGSTYGSFMALRKLAMRHACAGEDPTFAGAVVELAQTYYLDLRFSRACLLEKEQRTDYVRMLREMIAQADLSLVLNLESQAEWMYRQYLDNPADALSVGDYVDPEIDALTRLTASLWFEGESALSRVDCAEFGIYSPLVESLSSGRVEEKVLNELVDVRQEQAAWRYVEDIEGEGLTFFGDMFAALFPIEILALLCAYQRRHTIEPGMRDPFATRLLRVHGLDIQVDGLFIATADHFIARLEAKNGLTSPPAIVS